MMDWSDFLGQWQSLALKAGFQCDLLCEKDGLPVYGCRLGDPTLPTIYLSSGIHGDEPAGPQALLHLLKTGFFTEGYCWLICPVMNPTGLVKETRETSEGVDLNRDYFHCEADEVCAHISWLRKQPTPCLAFSLHEDWESSGFYYYEINLAVPAPAYEAILAAAAPYFPPEPESIIDDHEVTKKGWIFHPGDPDIPDGWPEAIYLAKNGCPLSLTLETPSSSDLGQRIRCHEAVVRAAFDCWRDHQL